GGSKGGKRPSTGAEGRSGGRSSPTPGSDALPRRELERITAQSKVISPDLGSPYQLQLDSLSGAIGFEHSYSNSIARPKEFAHICMSSEHFGQLAWQFKRMSGSSG